MKSRLSIPLAAALILVGAACQNAADETGPPESAEPATTETRADLEVAFRQLVADWDRHLNEGDAAAALGLYASDPVALPPDRPAAIGAPAVREVLDGIVAQPGMTVKNTMEDFWADGDLAALRGSYTLSTTAEDGASTTVSGKWVAIATRGPEGGWSVATNIWNLDAPTGE